MKKNLLLIIATFLVTSAFATVHTVQVADFSFTPGSMTVKLGDTVMWNWQNGIHTTTSTTIPSGAASWNSNITSSATSFMYVPSVLGTYNYNCTVHPTLMTGTFTVVSPAAAPVVNGKSFTISPNPCSSVVHLQFVNNATPANVYVTDMVGKQVMNVQCNSAKEADLDVRNLPNGAYVIIAVQDNKKYIQKVQVIH